MSTETGITESHQAANGWKWIGKMNTSYILGFLFLRVFHVTTYLPLTMIGEKY
jgi:hypothetical protein